MRFVRRMRYNNLFCCAPAPMLGALRSQTQVLHVAVAMPVRSLASPTAPVLVPFTPAGKTPSVGRLRVHPVVRWPPQPRHPSSAAKAPRHQGQGGTAAPKLWSPTSDAEKTKN